MIELIAISVCTFAAASIMIGQRIYESKHPLKNGSAHQAPSPKPESSEKFYLSYRSRRARENGFLNAIDRSQRISSVSANPCSRLEDPVQSCCSREETHLLLPLNTNACLKDVRSYANYLEHRYGINFNEAEVKEAKVRTIRLTYMQKTSHAAFVRPVLRMNDAHPEFQNSFYEKESELALHSMK